MKLCGTNRVENGCTPWTVHAAKMYVLAQLMLVTSSYQSCSTMKRWAHCLPGLPHHLGKRRALRPRPRRVRGNGDTDRHLPPPHQSIKDRNREKSKNTANKSHDIATAGRPQTRRQIIGAPRAECHTRSTLKFVGHRAIGFPDTQQLENINKRAKDMNAAKRKYIEDEARCEA